MGKTPLLVAAMAALFVSFDAKPQAMPISSIVQTQAALDGDNGPLDEVRDYLNERGEEMVQEEIPTEVPDLISQATDVYSDWRTGGWMAGLLALVSLLMGALKLRPLNDFFKSQHIMWLKPVLSAVFGGVGAGVAAFVNGSSIVAATIAGLVAGLGAVGLYEVAKRAKWQNRVK